MTTQQKERLLEYVRKLYELTGADALEKLDELSGQHYGRDRADDLTVHEATQLTRQLQQLKEWTHR